MSMRELYFISVSHPEAHFNRYFVALLPKIAIKYIELRYSGYKYNVALSKVAKPDVFYQPCNSIDDLRKAIDNTALYKFEERKEWIQVGIQKRHVDFYLSDVFAVYKVQHSTYAVNNKEYTFFNIGTDDRQYMKYKHHVYNYNLMRDTFYIKGFPIRESVNGDFYLMGYWEFEPVSYKKWRATESFPIMKERTTSYNIIEL